MEKLAIVGAAIAAILGFVFGRKKKKKPVDEPGPLHVVKEINDEVVEKVEDAGNELADSLSADAPTRHNKIMDWMRKRAGGPDGSS